MVENEWLFSVRGTDVYVRLTDRQRFLPVDGLVIPVGVRGGLAGGFAQSLKRELDSTLWGILEASIKEATRDGIRPDAPALVELKDPSVLREVLPNAPDQADGYYLIAATAGGAQGVRELSAAASSIVRLAAEAGIRRLAILPLGTGRGPFRGQARAAGAHMTRGIRIALAQLPPESLEEITLATRDGPVAEGAREEAQLYERNVAQPVSGDQPAWIDTLGVGEVANALGETLLLRGVVPPVTVGVFGSWGSGKTTVMRLIHQRMAEIRALPVTRGWPDDSGDGELPYFAGHVYQIWFNAWTYAKSNLWASLMQQIFSELNRQLGAEDQLRRDGYDPLAGGGIYPATLYADDQVGDANFLWKTLRRRNTPELKALEKAEREAETVAASRDRAVAKQQANLMAVLEEEPLPVPTGVLKSRAAALAGDASRDALKRVLDETSDTLDAAQVENVLDQLRGAGVTLRKVGQAAGQRRWITVLYAAVALLIVAGIFALTRLLDLEQVQRQITMLVSLAGALVPPLSAVLRVAQGWLGEVDQAGDEIAAWTETQRKKQLDASLRDLEAEQRVEVLEALEETGLDAEARTERLKEMSEGGNLVAYGHWLKELQANAAQLRSRIGPPADYASLPDFIQDRLDSKLYADKLGFMHQVEQDMKKLSDGLMVGPEYDSQTVAMKKDLFPRGSPRVVLYVDDLDRCPPRRVVEVLEAVQLLLKTGLFIVVLALDTRYATRALEKYYKEILQRDGDPSGLDYVEKIIGIPYRVQPVTHEGLENYLRLQMEIRDVEMPIREPDRVSSGRSSDVMHEPTDPARDLSLSSTPASTKELPPKVVKFLPEDMADLWACCKQISLTPRSIKRLINVFKLLEIYWFRTLQTDPPRPAKRTMIGLLAVSAGYPEIMREAFVQLERAYANRELTETTVGDLLDCFAKNSAAQLVPAGLLDRFRTDLYVLTHGQSDLAPASQRFFDVKLSEFGRSLLDTVRSFSYVGDPSYTVVDEERR